MNSNTSKKLINNLSSGIGATMVAITVHSYYLTIKDQRTKDNLSRTLELIKDHQINKAQDYYNDKITLSEIDQNKLLNELLIIKEKLGIVKNAIDKYETETSIGEKVADLILNTRPDFKSMINDISVNEVVINTSQTVQQTSTNQPITNKILQNLEEYRKSFETQSSIDESKKVTGFFNNDLSKTAKEYYKNKNEANLPSSSNSESIISNNNLIDEIKEFLQSYQE
jgi:DNA-binding protein Fis